jgi:general secretion pathway protein G
MKRTNFRRMRRQGFTLIELLIVLAILVGLMALVAPRILQSRDKAEINTAKSQIGLFQSALEKYEFDVRGMPGTEQGLASLTATPAASEEVGGAAAASGWDGPYLDSIPPDPWGMPYMYEYPPTRSSGSRPEIWSYGPDRAADTEDDICSWTGAAGSGGTDADGNPIDDPMDQGTNPMDQGPAMPPMDGPPMPGGPGGPGGAPPMPPGGAAGAPPMGPPPLPPAR